MQHSLAVQGVTIQEAFAFVNQLLSRKAEVVDRDCCLERSEIQWKGCDMGGGTCMAQKLSAKLHSPHCIEKDAALSAEARQALVRWLAWRSFSSSPG